MTTHLAILRQPFFNMILDGTKTIESRFSNKKIAPFNRVNIGDKILIKETGHDATIVCYVKHVEYYFLTPDIAENLRIKYGKLIGTDKFEDWVITSHKKYCTLIWIEKMAKINPMQVPKSHGAGWIVLN